MRWLYYSAHPWASPLRGRSELRSTLLPAELSLTPVAYLNKLPGIRCVAAFPQLELFRVYQMCSSNGKTGRSRLCRCL
ncbi:hypothetical protein CWD78_16880 [Dickeya dadantii]|nr:hypothetical protein [Dickeya dadantii]